MKQHSQRVQSFASIERAIAEVMSTYSDQTDERQSRASKKNLIHSHGTSSKKN